MGNPPILIWPTCRITQPVSTSLWVLPRLSPYIRFVIIISPEPLEVALNHAEDETRKAAKEKAAGADGITTKRDVKIVQLAVGKDMFIEASIHGLATGSARRTA